MPDRMKISIITPTHNAKYLGELKDSILEQTYDDWEWIILKNNGCEFDETQYQDERIKIIKAPFNSDSIGLLKKYAFMQGTGSILLEADHDDILTKDCLEEVAKAFKDEEIGFVYSDNAKLGRFTPYNARYGWTYRMISYKDKNLVAMHSFKPTPFRIGYVWFAPDHVRAWRKTTYNSIGGHDEKLSVCDDHDLICRTYLETKFKHIEKVLYIYRLQDTGSNTFIQRNALIQETTKQLYDKYIYRLAERFADINGLEKIDLCGGFSKPQGFKSIDLVNGDITADLEKGIPLPDSSVGVIRAHDALEHIKNKELIMKEIHRVLAPGGILLSRTPSTDGRGAFQDPTHVSFYNQNSFWYWTREQANYIHNKNHTFWEARLITFYPSKWHEENLISYVQADLEPKKRHNA